MSGHTPGPWHTGGITNPLTSNPRMSVWGPREAGAQSGAWVAKDMRPADASLIAAAPDLLAVLRDLEWIGMNDGRGVTHAMCPACSALKSRGSGHNHYCGLAAAIAKAEGLS